MDRTLFEQLLEALDGANWEDFAELCTARSDVVRREFVQWRQVPEHLRSSPERLNRYAQGLIQVARFFAEQLGDDALLSLLTGAGGQNPLSRAQARLQHIRGLMNNASYDEARGLLDEVIAELEPLSGDGREQLLTIARGWTGECLFHSGEPEVALPIFREVLERCEAAGDIDGVRAYLGNMFEVNRYLGRTDEAAALAERLAISLGAGSAQEHYRAVAARVRVGEPLLRVVARIDGRQLELDEISSIDDQCQFVFVRNRLSLRLADALVERGQHAASQGHLEEGLEFFRRAMKVDPWDPSPHYQAGMCLLEIGAYADAVEQYRQTEKRGPGWYHCRGDLWLAEALRDGRISAFMFRDIRQLEDGSEEPERKVERAEVALSKDTGVAHLWLGYGDALRACGRGADAVGAYRKGLDCDVDRGTRTRLLTACGASVEDPEDRRRLLAEAVELGGNLVAAAMAGLLAKQSGIG